MKTTILVLAASVTFSALTANAKDSDRKPNADQVSAGCMSNITGISKDRASRFTKQECTRAGEASVTETSSGEGVATAVFKCGSNVVTVNMNWMNDGDGGCRLSHFSITEK